LWLRAWGITTQVVIDDEWHALHKLAEASYSGIFKSFGLSDHSIPLTLFYKWMANSFGLAEGRLRAPQVVCGVALIPVCAWLAWGITRDRATAAGITINGVALGHDLTIYDYFKREVIGGPQAFVFSANDPEHLVEVLARKFTTEIVSNSSN